MHLLPAVFYLKSVGGGVYVIDELERSMHPMLVTKFIEFFVKTTRDVPCQLVFTTHESTLLDLDLMRRDESGSRRRTGWELRTSFRSRISRFARICTLKRVISMADLGLFRSWAGSIR